jgi:hypothetical protein
MIAVCLSPESVGTGGVSSVPSLGGSLVVPHAASASSAAISAVLIAILITGFLLCPRTSAASRWHLWLNFGCGASPNVVDLTFAQRSSASDAAKQPN